MDKKTINAIMRGTFTTNLYDVSFEDNINPSEKGLGFTTTVAAPNEEVARNIFSAHEPDCTILSIEERDTVICPLMGISEGITLDGYQEQAMHTCMDSAHNIEYMALNLIGEVGELAEKLLPFAKDYATRDGLQDAVINGCKCSKQAKMIRKGEYEVYQPIDTESEDFAKQKTAISKELGDILWQTAGTAEVLDLPLSIVGRDNLEKLAIRQMEGTIAGNGDGCHRGEGRTE